MWTCGDDRYDPIAQAAVGLGEVLPLVAYGQVSWRCAEEPQADGVGDVLQGELSARSEERGEGDQSEFEHPDMLES